MRNSHLMGDGCESEMLSVMKQLCARPGQTDKRRDGRTDRWADGLTDGPNNRRTEEVMDKRTDGRTDARTDEINGRTDERQL